MVYLDKVLQDKKILVVDDKPNNLSILFQYLKAFSCQVLIAENGTRAIEIAERYNPNLIILDIMMSGMDGFETCIHLKKEYNTQDIPIIFMTALAETKNKIQGFELGAVDYITKPINCEELLVRVKSHLCSQELKQKLAKETQKQKLLLELSNCIHECLELKSILQITAQKIKCLLDCELVNIVRVDNQKNFFLEACSSDTEVKLDQLISGNFFCVNPKKIPNQQKTIKFVDSTKGCEQNWEQVELDRPLKIVAPIVIGSRQSASSQSSSKSEDNLWGWLIIDYCEAVRWRGVETELVEALTTQIAIAIKQALLLKELTRQTTLDPLTKAYNRRYLDRQLNIEWQRLKRTTSSLSIILCDVDYFKLYNDAYGHQNGDRCLEYLAKAMSSVIKRPGDFFARYGGEEFIVVLPNTPQFGAIRVANSIQEAVKKLKITHKNFPVDSIVTVSMGIAHTIPHMGSSHTSESLVKAADSALYQAKRRGRNCIELNSLSEKDITRVSNQSC